MFKKILFIVLLSSFGGAVAAQTEEREANLKAAFIYNFTRYIDWDTSLSKNNFIIGVVGSSAVTSALTEIAKTSTVKNKRIIIKHFANPEEIENCHILFIPANLSYSLSSILEKTGKGVLTISEEEGYAKQGAAFNFIIRNDKLKFESNLKAIDAADLKASSQLLKLAIIVD